MSKPDGHISAFTLGRYQVGELDPDGATAVRAHLEVCPECAGRHQALVAEAAPFEALEGFGGFYGGVVAKLEQPPARARWLRPLFVLPPLFAAVSAAVLLVMVSPPVVDDGNRVKGEPGLSFFTQTASGVARGKNGATVAPGDALQFEVQPAGFTHLALAGIDAAGTVTRVFPREAAGSAPINGGHALLVPGSVVLDATPGVERFFAVLSRAPLAWERIEAIARAGTAPGTDVALASVHVVKP